jgi:mannose-1-phosphate guanylyltransferase
VKAMILAAGLGTRLRPLTSDRPKALVPVGNRPVIEKVIEYLKTQGVTEIVVNAYHHHKQIVKHLDTIGHSGTKIEVRVEPKLLGTGGGLKNTGDFWDKDPFFVINADILSDIDLAEAYEAHKKGGNLATLILHDHEPFNQVRIDDRLNITDIAKENQTGRLAFTGIHIIEPELLSHIKKGVYSNIIDCYRELIKAGEPIRGYISEGYRWLDIGSIESYIIANKDVLRGKSFLVDPDCHIEASSRLLDWAVIGAKAIIEHDVEIRRSILWKNVKIKEGIKVIDSIVTDSREVRSDLIKGIF